MKKGDIVKIYDDPYSCEKFEGEAELLRKLKEEQGGQEYWEVKFLLDGFRTQRWVNVRNC